MQTKQLASHYLLNYSKPELQEFVQSIGLEKFRGDQIYKGIFTQAIEDVNQISTLSKKIRNQISDISVIRQFKLVKTTKSDKDDTTKFLWELADGKKIESVIIYEGKRVTFCISSQVGCALDCKFCATGKMGFLRNLNCGEIIEQVLTMNSIAKHNATNIVFMGMGEPLLNLNNVLKASDILADHDGLAFSRKKITISTSGVIPGINKLAETNSPYSLAISLNSVFEDSRQKIMPISVKYPINDLMDAIQNYVKTTKKRVTFEYILIKDLNDSKKDAERLLKLTHKLPCKINIIPCNSDDPEYQPPSEKIVNWFSDYIHGNNKTSTVRLRKGWEIQAACGQLYYKHEDKTGKKITSAN
jgi:23S rRNA (adenine2503-C2)-methyltransferase